MVLSTSVPSQSRTLTQPSYRHNHSFVVVYKLVNMVLTLEYRCLLVPTDAEAARAGRMKPEKEGEGEGKEDEA